MGIIYSLIKGAFYLTTGVSIVALAILYLTKPENKTFAPYFEHKIATRESSNNYVIGTIMGKSINLISNTNIKDYIFFKYVIVRVGSQSAFFLGVLNTWIEL